MNRPVRTRMPGGVGGGAGDGSAYPILKVRLADARGADDRRS